MKKQVRVRVLEEKAMVYSAPSLTSEVVGELHADDEITAGKAFRQGGSKWKEATLPSGVTGYIGNIKVYEILEVDLNQKSVSVFHSPSESSRVTMTFKKRDRFTLLGPVKGQEKQWAKIRSASGEVGFIPGATKIRLVISTFSGEGSGNPMFKETEYVPFMLGVFLIGGLLGMPLTYGLILGLSYFQSLPWSLASCIVFLIMFRRNGTISWGRAIPAIFAVVMGANAYNQATGKPAFASSGFLGFVLVGGCGYVGIWIGRIFKK